MKKTVGTLRQLFEVLCRIQSSSWFHQQPGWKPSAGALKTWDMLIGSLPPVEERELGNLFQDSQEVEIDFSPRGKVLYLPPLQKNPEFVPVLSLWCNLDETRTKMTLKVMLISSSGDERNLRGVGFRLESPHGDEEDEGDERKEVGRHDFYHAQLIRSLGYGPSVECPGWLPETQPSFPLTADCPVTLVLCLLLSLYGKKYCWTFHTEHQIFDLKSHLDRLNTWIK
ncbi:MAG: hypothetical protein DDT32_00737 [Syntrophomonadaceae bacterium]|nr:hypothetical protein [Bacillota bacterium]MBT9146986.1 hypothetical protein [Bacillota bacterium]